MGYKEKLKSYAEGKLEGKEKENVENDIDRQRAIGEYLEESMDSGIFEEVKTVEEKCTGEDGELSMLVQKAVGRKLRKFGIWTGAAVLAITLFLMFGLSPLVDAMYYDPGKKIERVYEGMEYSLNAIDLPASVYTELHYPGKYFGLTTVEDKGFARYDISFMFETYDSKIETRRQIMDKGEMEDSLSDWRFECLSPFFTSGSGDKEEIWDDSRDIAELRKLPDTAIVTAALSFKDDLELTAVQDFQNVQVKVIYVPVRILDSTRDLVVVYGFSPEQMTMGEVAALNPDRGKYPYLGIDINDLANKGVSVTPDIWETHFKSMLRFMADQKEFNRIIGTDKYNYGNALKYVDKDGVKTYGVVVYGPVSEILRMRQDSRVKDVYVMDVKISKFSCPALPH